MPKHGKNPGKESTILQAAAELFTEKDFHTVLMEEVAVRAGVGKGTLYRYFPAKEELYCSTIFTGWDRLREQLEGVLQEAGSLAETLESLARQVLVFFWQRRHFLTLVHRLEHKADSQEKADWQRRREGIVRLVEHVLKKEQLLGARSAGDVRLIAETFLGMVRAAILYRGNRDTPEALARLVTSLFLHGVRGHTWQKLNGNTQITAEGKHRERKLASL
ncbi:MAG: TetR/AcrR family transcriptional regulator [Candidatus Binatia bacterium]